MSYTPHIWVDKELISDDKLNHIENGIYDEEYRATQSESAIAGDLAGEVTRARSAEALLAPQATTYTKTEVDNLLSQFETNIDWKEAVNTYADIATTYPNPVDGWTVNVNDTDYTYRYNGTAWVAISANAIPVATDSTNGLLSALLHAKLDGIDTMHGATSLLDGTSGLTPEPKAGDQDKFLRGDGTWAVPTGEADMTGATASTAGTYGLVPAPSAGDQNKVLKGDGTWGTLSSAGHAIWNKLKALLTTRPALWFKDAYVTDDSTNLSTNVEVIQTVTESAYDALATTADGLYDVDDGQTVPLMADNVGFDNTGTDMSATDVDGAIKELNADIDRGSISVTADGVKTYASLLNELNAMMTVSKLRTSSVIKIDDIMYHIIAIINGNTAYFTGFDTFSPTQTSFAQISVHPSTSTMRVNAYPIGGGVSSSTSLNASVPASGTKFSIIY